MSRLKCCCIESMCGPNSSAGTRMAGKQKRAIIDKNIQKIHIKKKVHVRVQQIQQGQEWLKKRAKIVKKVLKIPNQKSFHTGPTNSLGKSLYNRNEFILVEVGKGLVA